MMMIADPFLSENYRCTTVASAQDVVLFALAALVWQLKETLNGVSEDEYDWEPLSDSERITDARLPPEKKRVWRVYERDGKWSYDYALGDLTPSPFTTIAWIVNHIACTADMYLYCIQTGKTEGVERTWDDIPVPPSQAAMNLYALDMLTRVRHYLSSISQEEFLVKLNELTPAPWGEQRPTWLNLWGGIIEHTIQHTAQIAAHKEEIRRAYGQATV